MNKQKSDEWFKEREGRITGSIAGAILGLSPFKSQEQAIKELKKPVEHDEFTKDVIFRYGNEMEPQAIEMFKLDAGLDVKECGFYPKDEWLGASPDGVLIEDDKEIGLLEIKCPWGLRNENNPVFKSFIDLPHYYAQMQIEMYCAGFDQVFFYQYANGKSKLEIVEYDNKWMDINLPVLRDIWESQFKGISEFTEQTSRYFEVENQIKTLTQEKKDLMSMFKEKLNSEPGMIGNAVLKKSSRKGSVDYKKAFKEYEINEDDYRKKDTESWSLKQI